MTLRILDPRQEPESDGPRMAPALRSLDGAVIGLLDNAKIGTAGFYGHVEDILRSRFGVREFLRRRKPDATRPAPTGMLRELAGADGIISGIGD